MHNNIKLLIKEGVDWLQANYYSPGRIRTYETLWRRHLTAFMESHNLCYYSPKIGEMFVSESQLLPHIKRYNLLDRERCVRILNDILKYGEVQNHRTKELPPLYGAIGADMIDFLDYLRSERRSKLTIQNHHRYLLNFLNYLTDNKIYNLSEVTPSIMINYFSSVTIAKKHSLQSIRIAFKYWSTLGKIDNAVLNVFTMIKIPEKEKIMSVYEDYEIDQIIKSVRRTDPVGKRNYAILMLAVYCGLRASDIASLRLEHLKWEKDRIEFFMVKTGKFLSLPMRAEVGNALMEYIKYSRPNKMKSPFVFLSLVPPFNAITNKCATSVLRTIISKSGVNTSNRRAGAHIFRHSLASNLLRNNEAYPVISEVLGHSYTPNTMKYLRIDVTSMMKCALDVPRVNPKFYNQKGGVFYES